MYCLYYQARIAKERCWQMTAILRSYEHLAFDRTIDIATSTLEFFVPPDLEPWFVELMTYFETQGIVSELKRLPNRLQDEQI